MGKSKQPEIVPDDILEEVKEETPVKGPLRDAPYTPAWQVVNDRQDLYTDTIPPKIYSLEALAAAGVVDTTKLADYLTTEGYVKNTDYASGNTGGVVKVSPTVGSSISAAGTLICTTMNQASYDTAASWAFMSKGTFEAVVLNAIKRLFIESAGTGWTGAAAGTQFTWIITKQDDGTGEWEYDTTTP